MPTRNSGGVISRGYGEFSRILTRGFGRFFRTLSLIPKKKKEPIIIEFTFNIYSPVIKEFSIDKLIRLFIIKKLINEFKIKQRVIKQFNLDYNVNNKLSKEFSSEYKLVNKLNNQKLIDTVNLIMEDD